MSALHKKNNRPLCVLVKKSARNLPHRNDGSVAAYNIHYELNFRWHGKDYALNLETVISHNESSYLAGTHQRAAAVADMRQSALAQMVSLLDESAI